MKQNLGIDEGGGAERYCLIWIELNTATEIGTLQNVSVTKRGAEAWHSDSGGTGRWWKVTVDTENKIRRALGRKRISN